MLRDDIKGNACPDQHVEGIEKAVKAGIPFDQILALVLKYGKVVWAIISQLFPPTPASAAAPGAGDKGSSGK